MTFNLGRNTRLYWGFCPLQTPGEEFWCVSHTLFHNLCFILEYFGVVLTMFGLGSVILGVWRLTFYHMRPGLEIRNLAVSARKPPDSINLQTIFSYKQYKPPCCIPPNSKKLTLGKRVLNADRTTSCRKDCRHSILQTKFAYKPRCCIPPNSNKLNPWKTCSKYR